MSTQPEWTPAAHIARAKAEIIAGDHTAAQTHALIAIAELLSANLTESYNAGVLAGTAVGAEATCTAMSALLDITRSGQ